MALPPFVFGTKCNIGTLNNEEMCYDSKVAKLGGKIENRNYKREIEGTI